MLLTALVRKDLKRISGDRKALIVNLLLPLVLTAIMGFSFGGGLGDSSGMSAIPIAMVANDLPVLLQEKIAAGLQESGFFTVTWTDSSGADLLVRQGEVAAALVIPPDFMTSLVDGRKAAVQLWKDPGSPLKSGIVQQILERVFVRYQAGDAAYEALWPADRVAQQDGDFTFDEYFSGDFNAVWKRFRNAGQDTVLQAAGRDFITVMDHQVALSDAMASPRINLAVNDKSPIGAAAGGEEANFFDYVLPSFAVFFLMFAVAAAAREIHREREGHTLQRQLLSPMDATQFIVGKWVTGTMQGALQLLVLFLAGAVLFRVNLGPDPYSLLVVVLLTSMTASGVFILLALVCPSEKVMDNLSTVVILVSAMIGGNFGTVEALPAWAHTFGRFVFNYWANLGFSAVVIRDESLAGAMVPVLVLSSAAVTLFVSNVVLFAARSRRGGLL